MQGVMITDTTMTKKITDLESRFDAAIQRAEKNPAATALGKLGGSSKSKRKSAASRNNGKKGGRPKKPLAPIDQEK